MEKVIRFMDASGDTRVAFDEADAAQVAAARAEYEKAIKKAACVVTVPKDGTPGQVVHSFDELAADNVVIPAITGG